MGIWHKREADTTRENAIKGEWHKREVGIKNNAIKENWHKGGIDIMGDIDIMSKIYRFYKYRKNILLPILGIILISLITLPYFILGENSYVQVHDQMDGEILNYIYQAKYLLKSQVIPEFMNGMTKTSMLPPAPFGVLFYLIFQPFQAFALMHFFLLITGFLGMYLLLRKYGIRLEVCLITAVLFCYIPFYPVYGLAILGQPLLILCFWNLLEKKNSVISTLGIALYAGFSSLALVGYAWVVSGILFILYLIIKKKVTLVKRASLGVITLLGVYILTNIELLTSTFSKSGFATHREEMKLLPWENLLGAVRDLLFTGGSYAPVYGKFLFPVTLMLLIVILLLVRTKKASKKLREQGRLIATLLGTIFVGICFCTLWTSSFVLTIRQSLGGSLAYFQADRIYWIFPFIWVVILALDLDCLLEMSNMKIITKSMEANSHMNSKPLFSFTRTIIIILAGILFLVQGYQIAKDSTLNINARLLLVDGYHKITWKSLYMEDVFDDIKEAINKQEASQTANDHETNQIIDTETNLLANEDASLANDLHTNANSEQYQNTYSVVSLGIYPSIPLYNGFTCADGYSNNYSLDYKHQFRKIMANELLKNEEAKRYFDDWGNRLYLVSSKYGFNSLLQKGQGYEFSNLAFDMNAMRELGIRYIFSAAPIVDANELGMTLLSGSPFSSDTAYYEVWVYQI